MLKRLFDRTDFDPDQHATLRGQVAGLEVSLKRATSPEEREAIRDNLKKARADLKAITPDVVGVTVKHTGATERQNFSPNLIAQGTREGWLERKGETFVIHSHSERTPDPEKPAERELSHEGDLVFAIVAEPGTYCCFCGERLEDDGGQADDDGLTVGARHVAEEHAGQLETVQAAVEGAEGGRNKWAAAEKAARGLGQDAVGALNLANNPAGYRRINHFETVLQDGAGKPAASTIASVKAATAKGGKK